MVNYGKLNTEATILIHFTRSILYWYTNIVGSVYQYYHTMVYHLGWFIPPIIWSWWYLAFIELAVDSRNWFHEFQVNQHDSTEFSRISKLKTIISHIIIYIYDDMHIYIYMTASLWWLNLRLMALQLPNKGHLGSRNPKFHPAGGLRLQRRHCRHGDIHILPWFIDSLI